MSTLIVFDMISIFRHLRVIGNADRSPQIWGVSRPLPDTSIATRMPHAARQPPGGAEPLVASLSRPKILRGLDLLVYRLLAYFSTFDHEIEMTDTKLCTSCFESITAPAIVCKHCRRSQGWRGTLERVLTFLPLVIALVSAAAFFLAFAKPWVFPPKSGLVASFQGFINGQINFVVTNVGERAGVVGHAQLRYWDKTGSSTSFDLPIRQDDNTLVSPSSTVRVTVAPSDGIKELIWTAYGVRRDDNCQLTLFMVNFQGNTEEKVSKVSCWQATASILPERRREIVEGLPQT
jgi:hypothetical protein